MYLIVYTSNPDPLSGTSSADAFVNAAGRTVGHNFGFGAIDGEAMVTRARYWENVPSLTMFNITTSSPSSGYVCRLTYFSVNVLVCVYMLGVCIFNCLSEYLLQNAVCNHSLEECFSVS